MGEKAESEKQAEGVALSFVTALGLTDIFYGSLLIYAIGIRARGLLSQTFPATGNAAVDVVLLTSAAALAGKLVSLVVGWLLALVDLGMANFEKTQQLRLYLQDWRAKTGRPPINADDKVPVDVAMKTLRVDAPALARHDEQTGKSAEIAMGGTLLATVYAIVVSGAGTSPLRWAFAIAAACLFVLALFNEADYIAELRDSLGALRLTPGTEEKDDERLRI